eukprot:PhF_6_TR16920/c0_g1_i2/m.25418
MIGIFVVLLSLWCFHCTAYDPIPSWNPLPPQFPHTYRLNASTFFMPCNYSGKYDSSASDFYARGGGVVDFDWSNMRSVWTSDSPMDCEERLLEQARITKSNPLNKGVRVWVYKNLVKALPWMTDIRVKISDPQYSGWFLPFAKNVTPVVPAQGSPFYHDQEGVPSGNCGVPCGEYLFDHRNQSLREYLVNTYVMGPNGMGNPNVDGIFIDDFWSNRSWLLPWSNGDCATNPTGGPTEVDGGCIHDMGLSASDVRDIWWNWNLTMQAAFEAVVNRGKGYVYQLLNTNAGRDIQHPEAQCTSWMRSQCQPGSPSNTQPLLFQFTNETQRPLPYVDQDVAQFLLVRGPYAWIGYSWDACWPQNPNFPRPALLDKDFGEP